MRQFRGPRFQEYERFSLAPPKKEAESQVVPNPLNKCARERCRSQRYSCNLPNVQIGEIGRSMNLTRRPHCNKIQYSQDLLSSRYLFAIDRLILY